MPQNILDTKPCSEPHLLNSPLKNDATKVKTAHTHHQCDQSGVEQGIKYPYSMSVLKKKRMLQPY